MSQNSCSSGLLTRSIRNISVNSNATLEKPRGDPGASNWHDFVLLASTVKPTDDLHYAGHRVNTLLNTGTFKIGHGASFVVRGLRPLGCQDSSVKAVAAKIPVSAFTKDTRSGGLNARRRLRAAYAELRILSHPPLRSHRNIVELLGIAWMKNASVGELDESEVEFWPVLVLEYSPFGSLPDLWETTVKEKGLDTSTKITLCLDVAQGLKALHDCDIVHGDLKCENVLIFKDGQDSYTAKLADFGYSVTRLDKHDGLLGHTPPWNPPENNTDLNFLGLKAADIYTLGFVVWRIMTDGDHPFMDDTTGHIMDVDVILRLKKQRAFWEAAFRVVDEKMRRDDFLAWGLLTSSAKAVLYSTLHVTPLERSLRHVVTSLEQMNMLDLDKVRARVIRCMSLTPDGRLGIDTRQLGSVMMGEIMKDSLMENKTKDKGKEREVRREDDGDDGEDIDGLDMSLEAVDIGQGEGARKTGTSQPESSPRPKINLKYSDKTEEEALALIKNIEERHRDPMRNFRHPTREEDSDVFPGDVVITSFPAFTPAELRKKRMQLREQGKLPEISPSLPCLAAFNFTFSGQKSAPGAGEWKANKVFLLEGLSFLDPLFRLIATRIQKEQPGASIRMESDTLELPTTNMEAGVSSRAQLKITRVVEPKTDLLYLVAQNGGYVEEDQWTGQKPEDVGLLNEAEILSPVLAFGRKYKTFANTLAEQPVKVRQFLAKSWIAAHKVASPAERRSLARMLFIYYLEVESNTKESLKWLLSCAEDGDVVIQPIVPRIFSALQTPLPDGVVTGTWLERGAIRGSSAAMEDLRSMDPGRAENAETEFATKLGGIGINMFKSAEVLIRHLSEEIIRLADVEIAGRSSSAVNPREHLLWATEIVSSFGCNESADEDHWSPDDDDLPEPHHKHWEAYSEDPARAIRDTFRIEEDVVYALNVVGDTILHFAAARGHHQLLSFLVETYKPPLNVLNIFYETPLLQACRSGHAHVANYLLDKGAVPFRTRRDESPLHWLFAVQNKEERKRLATRLMAQGCSAADIAFSPTEIHVVSGREPQTGSFIQRSSALQWAVEQRCINMLEILLSDSLIDDRDLKSAMIFAAEVWESDCLQLLVQSYRQRCDEHQGIDREFLYECLLAAASVDVKLYHMLRHGRDWVAAFGKTRRMLQDLGARPYSTETPPAADVMPVMVLATIAGTPEIVADLLSSGWTPELDLLGPQEQVPIALAAIRGRHEIFSKILEFENKDTLPDRMAPLRDGQTVYHWLAESKHAHALPLSQQLLSLGVAYAENDVRSPFEQAVRSGDFAMADLFLHRCGADIERRCGYGDAMDQINAVMELSRRRIMPTLLGCLVLENAVYMLPAVRYLAARGAAAVVEPWMDLNVYHCWALGGALDDDPGATESYFEALRELFPDIRLFVRLEQVRVSPPLAWAVRRNNTAAVKLMAQCAWFSAGNLSFEAVGKMSWRQAHDIMSLDGLTSSARAALQNSAALLQQKGFVGDVEARAGSECEFWQGWLARATLSEDEDVQKLTDQVRIWARRAAPSTLLTPITNPPQKERPISYLKKMFSKRSPD